jgi:dTDP-4-amino-4,6-dideoxygalactose transaminase
MRIPLVDLAAQHAADREEIVAAVARVLDSGRYVLGPEVTGFESELAARLDVPHVIGVSSGSDALLATLLALGVGAGDRVVTTAVSFFATAGSIARVGARPVFVDVDPDTFNLDPRAAAAAVDGATKAIITVHLFGRPADPIATDVPVVEDAAQAVGAAALAGIAGCLSFFPTKNLGAVGDAGAIYTRDAALAERLRMVRVHGSRTRHVHDVIGGNFRLDALQAAILAVKLRRLDEWTAARRANAARYLELFAAARLPPEVVVPRDAPGHVYNQFVLRVPRRDALQQALRVSGIDTEVYYPVPLHLQPCFRDLGGRPGALPVSERLAAEALAIPVSPALTVAQQDEVVERIVGFYAS